MDEAPLVLGLRERAAKLKTMLAKNHALKIRYGASTL
jgi:hypothetical protein